MEGIDDVLLAGTALVLGMGNVMSFIRTFLVFMLTLPGYTYALNSSTSSIGKNLYLEGYYMPSLLERNVFSIRQIVGKSGGTGNNSSALVDHDIYLNSSVLSAIGGGIGFAGSGVGLKFSLDCGNFSAKKVGSYMKDAIDGYSDIEEYVASRISGISSAALTVSMCYERLTTPSPVSIGLYVCAGGGATFVGISPGNYARLTPSFRVKSGVLLPVGRSLALSLGAFYRETFGSDEYESVYDNAVSLDGRVRVPVASKLWGDSGVESKFELSDLGVELGLRFNLRLDST